MKQYPDILWVLAGYGNEGMGGNAFYVIKHIFEPSYLMGMIAGMMTKTNLVGGVGTYPLRRRQRGDERLLPGPREGCQS